MIHQDLDVIDIGNPKLKKLRQNTEIKEKKVSSGAIMPATGKKIKDEDEGFSSLSNKDYVGGIIGKQIQQIRLAKKMTQKQLATSINEKPQVIQDYEQGKAVPNQQIICKIERALGVKLPKKKTP